MRISNSSKITAFIYSETNLTLEKTTELIIAPYNLKYNGLYKNVLDSKLNP